MTKREFKALAKKVRMARGEDPQFLSLLYRDLRKFRLKVAKNANSPFKIFSWEKPTKDQVQYGELRQAALAGPKKKLP